MPFPLLLLLGCASYTALSPEERGRIERDYHQTAQPKYLRLSFYVLPFFGDGSKKLLSAVPPDQIRLIERPDGTPIEPGPIEGILPVGAPVRLLKVEFPTSWVVAGRLLTTPRSFPWVYLEPTNGSPSPPYIIVLSRPIKSEGELRAEMQSYLSDNDLTAMVANWTESVRSAARAKQAIVEMPAEALEIAWGYPLKRRITFDQGVKREEWTYLDAKRIAYLEDGRVVKLQDSSSGH